MPLRNSGYTHKDDKNVECNKERAYNGHGVIRYGKGEESNMDSLFGRGCEGVEGRRCLATGRIEA